MKKIALKLLAFVVVPSLMAIGCGPNDDSGSMDQKNSDKEGAVDSSRMIHDDTSSMRQH